MTVRRLPSSMGDKVGRTGWQHEEDDTWVGQWRGRGVPRWLSRWVGCSPCLTPQPVRMLSDGWLVGSFNGRVGGQKDRGRLLCVVLLCHTLPGVDCCVKAKKKDNKGNRPRLLTPDSWLPASRAATHDDRPAWKKKKTDSFACVAPVVVVCEGKGCLVGVDSIQIG